MALTGIQDQGVDAQGTSTDATATMAATTNAADVIMGVMTNCFGTDAITQNATNLPNLVREDEDNAVSQSINVSYRIVTGTGTYTGNWAIAASGPWLCVVVALKEAGGAAATRRYTLLLTGVG